MSILSFIGNWLLGQYCIKVSQFGVLSSFLCYLHQMVRKYHLSEAKTSFAPLSSCGVPQVYVLGPFTLLPIHHCILPWDESSTHRRHTSWDISPIASLLHSSDRWTHIFLVLCGLCGLGDQPVELIFIFHMQHTDHRLCLKHHRRLLEITLHVWQCVNLSFHKSQYCNSSSFTRYFVPYEQLEMHGIR